MKSEYMSENSSHFLSLNYHINKAVFKHELGRLEIVRKLLLDSTLYNTSACNPISTFGSAIMISPSDAKEAVTPPVVGSVITAI